ncbi:hypothetical protein GOODEAATRI_022762 [Goodea atripinnis]|uniref:Transmembrane protein n=1 Tax=Goodea atripinnis TaxID=208336 RepID=A0ABV0MK38_9TELE
MLSGGRGERDRSIQQNRPASAFSTAYRYGSRVRRKKCEQKKNPKKICTNASVDSRNQGSNHLMACNASQCHTLYLLSMGSFFFIILFYFFRHTNNSHYIILPN